MTFLFDQCCGFESGHIDQAHGGHANVVVNATAKHCGRYGMQLNGAVAYATFEVGDKSKWNESVSFWFNPYTCRGIEHSFVVRFMLNAIDYVDLAITGDDEWDVLISAKAEATSEPCVHYGWNHVQAFVEFENSPNGHVKIVHDGRLVLDWYGDTMPGTDPMIANVSFRNNAEGTIAYLDCIIMGYDDVAGICDVDAIFPVEQVDVIGWNHEPYTDYFWETIDEYPPNDSDYAYAIVNAMVYGLGCEAYNTSYDILGITFWLRTRNFAGTLGCTPRIKRSTTTLLGDNTTKSSYYYQRMSLDEDPVTSTPWVPGALNLTYFGARSDTI